MDLILQDQIQKRVDEVILTSNTSELDQETLNSDIKSLSDVLDELVMESPEEKQETLKDVKLTIMGQGAKLEDAQQIINAIQAVDENYGVTYNQDTVSSVLATDAQKLEAVSQQAFISLG